MKKTIRRLFSRAAMTLLMLLLTAATAWADVTTIVEDDDEHNLVNPVFTGVTVSNAKHDYDNHADDDIATARQLTAFNICFSDGATTGILATDLTDYTEKVDAWYSLDGRKLSGKPTKKGIYIYKGKKVK